MADNVRTVLLWLFVINLGIAFGAGVYEARVVIPAWAKVPPAEWPNTGLMFWVYVTTVPLTLLTLANGVAGWLERSPRRRWWLAGVAVAAVERMATFGYFIPTMLRLSGMTDAPEAEVRTGLEQWLMVNHGRHVLTLTAWVLSLKALASPR